MTDSSPDHPETRLRFDAVTLARGDRVLAEGLTFQVGPGDAALVRGPNGVGKTTLLRALAGFLTPAAGDLVLEIDRAAAAPEDAAAYVGHADGLRSTETPRAHLAFVAAWRGGDRGAIVSALETFGLLALADAPARRLSAGQKRRTALARLLVAPRPLWLLDEPASPLDLAGRAILSDVVTEHRRRGGLVVAAVHDDPGWPDTRAIDLPSAAAA